MSSLWVFDSWAEFFAMGGHGFYVWASYGVCLSMVIALVGLSRLQFTFWRNRELRRLERLQKQASYDKQEQQEQ